MRILAAAAAPLLLASCVLGPAAGDTDDLRQITAGQIEEDVRPEDIRIQSRYVLLFTTHWTAVTPKGRYKCTRDLSTDNCEAISAPVSPGRPS